MRQEIDLPGGNTVTKQTDIEPGDIVVIESDHASDRPHEVLEVDEQEGLNPPSPSGFEATIQPVDSDRKQARSTWGTTKLRKIRESDE